MRKRLLAALLAFTFVCSSAISALAAEPADTTKLENVLPYSEEEDPLTSRYNGDLIEVIPPDCAEDELSEEQVQYDANKVTQYSFLTGKEYNVPSGYNIYHGIDVSKWNETINWSQVKNAGVDYAIIRVGYRGTSSGSLYEDPQFRTYIEGAISVGLPIGVYVYSQALTVEEAREEANFALQCIEGYQIDLPIIMDYEFYGNDGRLYNEHLSKSQMTENALAFCDTISNAGYQPMLYANKSFLTDSINASEVAAVAPIWLAHYTTNTSYTGEYAQWQYSDAGTVSGIDTNVDSNFYLTKGALVSPSEDCIKGFTDVLSSSWYADAVSFVVDHGLMSGTSSTKFSPNATLSRVMAAQILYSLTGKPAAAYDPDLYSDVPADAWYTDAVMWANETGVMKGYSNGKFGVNDVITREQIATILYSYSEKYGVDTSTLRNLNGYTDADSISSYAVTPMQWAVANGIISGRTETTLVPKGSATRAECAAMLQSYLTGVGASLLPA